MAATPVAASARATAAHWRRPVSVSGTSREPAKRRSRTHVDSPCRMTKTLSLPTTRPFYLDSDPGPDRRLRAAAQAPPAPNVSGVESAKAGCSKGSRCEAATRARPRRMPHTPQGGAEVANEADGPFSATCLELDELGEDDVRHGADLVQGGGRHGVVEVQKGHRAAAATLPAELHAGDVDAVAPAERADAADHARDVEVGEHEDPAVRQGLERIAVDPDEARIPLEEDGAVDRHDAAVRAKLGAHETRVVGALCRGGL